MEHDGNRAMNQGSPPSDESQARNGPRMTAQTVDIVSAAAIPSPAGPWKFWGTVLWSVAILAAMMIVGGGGTFAALLWLNPDPNLSVQQLHDLILSKTVLLSGVFGAATVSGLLVLALAVRLSRLSAMDYLGLALPQRRDVLLGLAVLAGLYVVFAVITHFFSPNATDWFSTSYRSARSTGMLPALAVMIVVFAPVGEELIVRGFMLRGWAASRLGPTAAIVLTSLLWTVLHTQYEVLALAYVFSIGLLLGWLRQRTGSTLLTMMLHATQNGAALVQIALAGWLG